MHDYVEACARDPHTGCAGDMLVMTSGNMHDEPIEIDDACAYAFARLAAGGGRVSGQRPRDPGSL
jgi:hypothetical protein